MALAMTAPVAPATALPHGGRGAALEEADMKSFVLCSSQLSVSSDAYSGDDVRYQQLSKGCGSFCKDV
jgi:hypothetical protein